MADWARHLTIEECEIGHIGTYGIWFRQGCRVTLDWLGFVSNADADTAYYLDNLELANQEL